MGLLRHLFVCFISMKKNVFFEISITVIWMEEYSSSFPNKLFTTTFDASQKPLLQRLDTCTAKGHDARAESSPSRYGYMCVLTHEQANTLCVLHSTFEHLYVTDTSVSSVIENYTPRAELIFHFQKQYNRSPYYSATN